MDKLSCITAFISIIEQGSLHKAAKKLHLTDAAVSKQLSKLEDSLNVTLLKRGHGKIELTDVGQQYYLICKDATEKLNSAHQLIEHVTTTPKGLLKICCVKHNIYNYLMPYLKSFVDAYPEIRLTFILAERIPDISRGEVDILFGLAMPIPDQENNLIRKKIGQTRDIICTTTKYLETVSVPKKPQDLLQLSYIAHLARVPVNIISFDNGSELKVDPLITFDDHDAIIEACLQGLGYVYVKEYMVEKHLKNKQLVEILPQYNKSISAIYFYYRYQMYPDPKVQAFIKHFVNRVI